jgi:hypothetical protein
MRNFDWNLFFYILIGIAVMGTGITVFVQVVAECGFWKPLLMGQNMSLYYFVYGCPM